jgi:hypothetical protein
VAMIPPRIDTSWSPDQVIRLPLGQTKQTHNLVDKGPRLIPGRGNARRRINNALKKLGPNRHTHNTIGTTTEGHRDTGGGGGEEKKGDKGAKKRPGGCR